MTAAGQDVERQWARMLEVYTARITDLSMLTSIGQGLISAVTLSAALGAPLLIIGTERTLANAVFGVGLLGYLIVLGLALRNAFVVLYTPIDRDQLHMYGTGPMNWHWVAQLPSPAAYRQYLDGLSEADRLGSIVEQDWIAARLVADKARRVKATVALASASLVMLGLLIMARFTIVFLT